MSIHKTKDTQMNKLKQIIQYRTSDMLTIIQVQISYVFRTYLPERITLAVDMLIVSAPSPPVPTISNNFPNAKYGKGWEM